MMLKKSLQSLLIYLGVSLSVFANTDIEVLRNHCMDKSQMKYSEPVSKNGNTFRGVYIEITDETKKKYMFDCSYFKIGPVNEDQYIKNCEDPNLTLADKSLIDSVDNISEKLQCDKESTAIMSKQCMEEVGCNMLRSATPLALKFVLSNVPIEKTEQKACLNVGKSDCFTEVVAGIMKNIWGNIEAVGYLAKSAFNGAVNFFSSDEVAQAEKKTSESLHVAANAEDSFLDKFKKDPVLAIKEMGISVYKMISQAIAKNFACAQWSGAPHISKCLKPLDNWDCSSCDQKLNAVCGVSGVLSGEIVTAYLTGGTLNALSHAGKVAKIDKIIKGVKAVKVPKQVSTAASVATKAGGKVIQAALYLPLKTISALYKIPVLASYLRLMDDAFMLGFKGPSVYLATKLQSKVNLAESGLIVKQQETNLQVAKKDLELANDVKDSATKKLLKLKVAKLEKEMALRKDVPINSVKETPTKAEVKKMFTQEQKIEILTNKDFLPLVNRYKSASEQEKAIEIISILKNHNPTKLNDTQIVDEFDKLTKQCF